MITYDQFMKGNEMSDEANGVAEAKADPHLGLAAIKSLIEKAKTATDERHQADPEEEYWHIAYHLGEALQFLEQLKMKKQSAKS